MQLHTHSSHSANATRSTIAALIPALTASLHSNPELISPPDSTDQFRIQIEQRFLCPRCKGAKRGGGGHGGGGGQKRSVLAAGGGGGPFRGGDDDDAGGAGAGGKGGSAVISALSSSGMMHQQQHQQNNRCSGTSATMATDKTAESSLDDEIPEDMDGDDLNVTLDDDVAPAGKPGHQAPPAIATAAIPAMSRLGQHQRADAGAFAINMSPPSMFLSQGDCCVQEEVVEISYASRSDSDS